MKNNLLKEDLDELNEVVSEIKDLIEDNNQNIKDCLKVLNKIHAYINPSKPSVIKTIFSKILNIKQ
ncbi:hypothetical protein UFOVP410_42 [uncultured Caudovirales phage]|uniref:Uncharacterized protein n=1 Tax=uncultured Caudovirales phage TaxID=2100421 RepID=A0A6J5M728_9CAUD|nr:hypothetical protein UFOVP410_42 [uncultured Caudovirales phage]